jgi:DNA modification methylase
LCPLEDRKQSDVWDIERPSCSELHPTTKPVELVLRCLVNSSRNQARVLDLFMGSGTTLIACEKTGRRCYGMELDPIYCDVIVKRWEEFTGKKAELLQEADCG